MRTPAEIIDAVAAAKNLPVPVPSHWPFGYGDVLAILAERDAEWVRFVEAEQQKPRERQEEGT